MSDDELGTENQLKKGSICKVIFNYGEKKLAFYKCKNDPRKTRKKSGKKKIEKESDLKIGEIEVEEYDDALYYPFVRGSMTEELDYTLFF